MRPAIGQHRGSAGTARLAKLAIGFIAIDLQDAVILAEELRRPHAAPARHVAVNDRGWNDPAMRAVVADHRPPVARLRLADARRPPLRCRLVAEQAISLPKPRRLPVTDRLRITPRAAPPSHDHPTTDPPTLPAN